MSDILWMQGNICPQACCKLNVLPPHYPLFTDPYLDSMLQTLELDSLHSLAVGCCSTGELASYCRNSIPSQVSTAANTPAANIRPVVMPHTCQRTAVSAANHPRMPPRLLFGFESQHLIPPLLACSMLLAPTTASQPAWCCPTGGRRLVPTHPPTSRTAPTTPATSSP